jgi:hypothetical protein
MLPASGKEIHDITGYMQSQAPDLTVEFIQKVYSENVSNARHDVWDVHTNVDRWWVITSPTNLYSQSPTINRLACDAARHCSHSSAPPKASFRGPVLKSLPKRQI